MSVNTIALEEMCISDDTAEGTSNKEPPDVSVSTNDPKRSTILSSDYETKGKKTFDAKSTESFAIATTSLQKTRSKKSLSFASNAESINAKQRSFEGKDERKGSTTATGLEEERPNVSRESKRTKFIRKEDSKDGVNVDIELSQTSKRSAVRYPRITKIEKVRYGLSPLTKRVRNVPDASKSFVSNNFDYETNASRATSFALNEALAIKGILRG